MNRYGTRYAEANRTLGKRERKAFTGISRPSLFVFRFREKRKNVSLFSFKEKYIHTHLM